MFQMTLCRDLNSYMDIDRLILRYFHACFNDILNAYCKGPQFPMKTISCFLQSVTPLTIYN